MMGATGASSSIASQRASPWPGQVSGWCCCKYKSHNFLPCYQKSQMRLDALPRLRYCFKDKTARLRTERFSFLAEKGRLGLVSPRSVVRAQKGDQEDQKLDKVDKISTESWVSSIQRASTVSRIFVATLVWICLFLWISIMNSEIGGGRPGRRRPRK